MDLTNLVRGRAWADSHRVLRAVSVGLLLGLAVGTPVFVGGAGGQVSDSTHAAPVAPPGDPSPVAPPGEPYEPPEPSEPTGPSMTPAPTSEPEPTLTPVAEGTPSQNGSDNGGGIIPSGPVFNLNATLDGLKKKAVNGFISSYNKFSRELLGTPHPINDGYLGVLGQPTGEGGMERGYKKHVVGFLYNVIIAAGILTIFLAAIQSMIGGVFAKYKSTELIWMIFFGAVAAAVAWQWITFHQMFSHEMTMYAIPSGEEIMADSGSQAKFLAANVFVIIILATVGIAEAAGLAMLYGGRQILLDGLLTYMMVPIIVLQFWGLHRWVRKAAIYAHFQYLALVYWPVGVAFAFDYAFGTEWEASGEGFMAFVQTIAVYSGAIVIPIFMSTTALAIPFLIGRYGGRGTEWVRSKASGGSSGAASETRYTYTQAARDKAANARSRVFGNDGGGGGGGGGSSGSGYPEPAPAPSPAASAPGQASGSSPADVRAAVEDIDPKNPVESDWKQRERVADQQRYRK